jgi:hypothetical protein
MVQNCKYCGLCSCTEEKPLCDEQKSGKYSDHPARQFQVGDWIKHTDDRIGVVAFVRPLEFGVIVHFCYKISPKKQTCDWYQPEKLTKVNDEVYLPFDGGKIITHNYPSNCLVKEHLC